MIYSWELLGMSSCLWLYTAIDKLTGDLTLIRHLSTSLQILPSSTSSWFCKIDISRRKRFAAEASSLLLAWCSLILNINMTTMCRFRQRDQYWLYSFSKWSFKLLMEEYTWPYIVWLVSKKGRVLSTALVCTCPFRVNERWNDGEKPKTCIPTPGGHSIETQLGVLWENDVIFVDCGVVST